MSETQNNNEDMKENSYSSTMITLEPPALKDFNILTYSGSLQKFFAELISKDIKYLSIRLGMIYGECKYGQSDMIISDKCVTSTIISVDRKVSSVNYKAVEIGLVNTLKYLKSKKISIDQINVMVCEFDEMTVTKQMDIAYQLELIIADVISSVNFPEVPVSVMIPATVNDEIFMPLSGDVEKDTKKDKKKKKMKGKK